MGPTSVVIAVVLGFFVPVVTMVALPPRAMYLVVAAHPLAKLISLAALAAWGWCLWATFRPVAPEQATGVYWLLIGTAWFFAEVIHAAAGRRR